VVYPAQPSASRAANATRLSTQVAGLRRKPQEGRPGLDHPADDERGAGQRGESAQQRVTYAAHEGTAEQGGGEHDEHDHVHFAATARETGAR
jgi:hypothetical protein